MATATIAAAASTIAGSKALLPGLMMSSTPTSPTAMVASRHASTRSLNSTMVISVAVTGTACMTAVTFGSGMWNSAAMNSPVASRSNRARTTTTRSRAR